MRLIDIEAVLKAAELAGKEYVSIDFLKDFEQVDAVPVVRGEWIEHEDEMECPQCGCFWNYCDNDTERFNYCPNCGADMRRESKVSE